MLQRPPVPFATARDHQRNFRPAGRAHRCGWRRVPAISLRRHPVFAGSLSNGPPVEAVMVGQREPSDQCPRALHDHVSSSIDARPEAMGALRCSSAPEVHALFDVVGDKRPRLQDRPADRSPSQHGSRPSSHPLRARAPDSTRSISDQVGIVPSHHTPAYQTRFRLLINYAVLIPGTIVRYQ